MVPISDLNGGGHPDIVVANTEDETVSVFIDDGHRRFHQPTGSPFPCGHLPNDIAVADMNGDGKLDLIVVP